MAKKSEVVNKTSNIVTNNGSENKPKRKYYTVEDIVEYVKSAGVEEVTTEDVYNVFENLNLVYMDVINGRLRPTEYMRKSGICFETKAGKLLFTETGWKKTICTDDQEYNKAWLMGFCEHCDKLKGLYE